MGNGFKITIHGTEFEVEYSMSGQGDDCEIDEMAILVGGEWLSPDCLNYEVLKKIDDAAYDDFWNHGGSVPDYEPDEEDIGGVR